MNYKNEQEVMNRVREHYDWAVKQSGQEVLAVFLQGSWNYSKDLCDEKSDVDTKCWVLPTLEDLALNKKPSSYVHLMENEEHCEVKDVRLYVEQLKKQNPSYLEVLFTNYFVVNPKYKDLFEELLNHKEEVAHYDEVKALNCMLGLALQKQKGFTKPREGNKEEVEKYGYDGKDLSHALRLETLMKNYLTGFDFGRCLTLNSRYAKFLWTLKRHKGYNENNELLNEEQAVALMEVTVETMKRLVNDFTPAKNNKENVDKVLDSFLLKCFKRNFE